MKRLHALRGWRVKPGVNMMQRWLLAGVLCIPALGAEYAVLENGFRMRIDRHERAGDIVRLFTTRDAFVELPASSVVAFEAEDYVAPPPAPIAPSVSPVVVPPDPVELNKAEPLPKSARDLVEEAALKHGLPPQFVHEVAKAESAYRQNAVSPKGAIGIMQLMPQTAAALNADPYNAEQNVEAGTKLLRDLLLQYKDHPDQVKRALAAYNAGPGAVAKYKGVPPYRETQLYVNRIVEAYRKSLGQGQ
jgi:soluble lytic murein transglycosylase-like protein